MIPLLLATTIIIFLLLKLVPGDPVLAMLGTQGVEEQIYRQYREELGLDKPLHIQYFKWLGRVVQGDLGRSIITRQKVGLMIRQRLAATSQLVFSGFLLGILIALPIGIIAAVKRNTIFDLIVTQMAVIGTALPTFWLGMMLILLFALKLQWLPPSGYVSFSSDFISCLKYMLLPSVTLGLHLGTVLMRQTRSAMLDVLGKDYIRTAKAKGLSEMTIICKHALKNALVPIITVSALQIQRLIAGAVIIENVFAIPGIGRMMMDAIHMHDFPVMQGCVLVVAMLVLFINLTADILYAYVNPRISYQ
ncbi:MAG: ABC transporter permease [Firmicutes bacterium]|nr:ABC transporter permease [Bacillota bacterium]